MTDKTKLREAVDLLTGNLDSPRLTPSQILAVGSLLESGREHLECLPVLDAPRMWWCKEWKHVGTKQSCPGDRFHSNCEWVRIVKEDN